MALVRQRDLTDPEHWGDVVPALGVHVCHLCFNPYMPMHGDGTYPLPKPINTAERRSDSDRQTHQSTTTASFIVNKKSGGWTGQFATPRSCPTTGRNSGSRDRVTGDWPRAKAARSEEHTSELQ